MSDDISDYIIAARIIQYSTTDECVRFVNEQLHGSVERNTHLLPVLYERHRGICGPLYSGLILYDISVMIMSREGYYCVFHPDISYDCRTLVNAIREEYEPADRFWRILCEEAICHFDFRLVDYLLDEGLACKDNLVLEYRKRYRERTKENDEVIRMRWGTKYMCGLVVYNISKGWIDSDSDSMNEYLLEIIRDYYLCSFVDDEMLPKFLRFYLSRGVPLKPPLDSFLGPWRRCHHLYVIEWLLKLGLPPDKTGVFLSEVDYYPPLIESLKTLGFE